MPANTTLPSATPLVCTGNRAPPERGYYSHHNYRLIIHLSNSKIHDQSIPLAAKQQLSHSIATGQFTAKAFSEFLRLVDANQAIADYRLPDRVTFDLFGFRKPQRQAGLRMYDDGQLFGLALMQRHCGYTDENAYALYKPYIEQELTQRETYADQFNSMTV